MAICLSAGTLAASLVAQSFTLAWTHSIEKTRWEEDWRIAGDHLEIVAARIRGSGAGMEAPAGAELRFGVWHYRPALAPQAQLLLTHSPHAAGYTICLVGGCVALAELLPGLPDNAVVKIAPCSVLTASGTTPDAQPTR